MPQEYQQYMNLIGFGQVSGGFAVLYSILVLWSIIWKGIALWKAVKNNDKYWYIAMLVINTVGVLEILYIFFFSERSKKEFQPISFKAAQEKPEEGKKEQE